MLKQLNSLRMRAERNGQHISGAERLLALDELEFAAVEMVQRALQHPRGVAQKINIQVESVPASQVITGQLLDFSSHQVDSWEQGRGLACQLLVDSGISPATAASSIEILARGAGPCGQSMRGALLIDIDSGERLETDPARGVRVSRMDLTAVARRQLSCQLERIDLNNPHVIEALILATKVSCAHVVIAELCWSDDPDYQAGYVASKSFGYQRINLMKPMGEVRGGRVFFVRSASSKISKLVDYLEKSPLLIDRLGKFAQPVARSEAQ